MKFFKKGICILTVSCMLFTGMGLEVAAAQPNPGENIVGTPTPEGTENQGGEGDQNGQDGITDGTTTQPDGTSQQPNGTTGTNTGDGASDGSTTGDETTGNENEPDEVNEPEDEPDGTEAEEEAEEEESEEDEEDGVAIVGDYIPDELDEGAPSSDGPDMIGEIPATYMADIDSLKAKWPNTRSQSPYGTCWCFSGTGAAEFSSIAQGNANTSVNYSEWQAAYFMYHDAVDPIGGLEGDKITIIDPDYLNTGHSTGYYLRSLLTWKGLANESDYAYPYDYEETYTSFSLTADDAYNHDQSIVTDYRRINFATDTDAIKQAIIDNGAVVVSYFADKKYATGGSFSNDSYYCYDEKGTNHAVMIVGWDDTYSKSNFSTEPEHDGAWVVRNSWSTTPKMSNYSYFYMSYDDKSLASTAWEVITAPASTYDNNYQYDGSQFASSTYYVEKTANVFEVGGAAGAPREILKAVGISSLNKSDLNYQIDIYVNPDDWDPESGEHKTQATTTGKTSFSGYYTIDLNDEVVLYPGDKYSVVVTLVDDKGTYYGVDHEYGVTYSDITKNTVTAKEGQSLALRNGSWTSVIANNSQTSGNYCIKAYTKDDYGASGNYSINFIRNGSKSEQMPAMTGLDEASTYTLSDCTYTRSGYTFAGWNTKADGSGTSYSNKASVTGLATGGYVNLYAQWEPVAYTIVLDKNGGQGSMTDMDCVYGQSYNLTENTYTKSGYIFTGWNTKADGSGTHYVDGEKVKNLTDTVGVVTLYADWMTEADLFTIDSNGKLTSVNKTMSVVEIPSSVKVIGSSVFSCNTSLKKVVIPTSCKEICYYAFSDCENLTTVEGMSGVEIIGLYAFFNDKKLTNITLPNSLNTLKNGAFQNCSSIENIVISSGVSEICAGAFRECSGLKSVEIKNTNISIEDNAFNNCTNLETVTLAKDVKKIGVYAFYECEKLGSFNISGNDITSIGNYAFSGCESLSDVDITSNSLETIGNYAFYKCTSLTDVDITADNITTIGNSAFSQCPIATINLGENLKTIGSDAFLGTNLTKVEGWISLESIGGRAFCNCTSLTQVVLYDDLTSIGDNAFSKITGTSNYQPIYANLSLTIKAPAGSYAQTYANEKGFTYEALTNYSYKYKIKYDGNGETSGSVSTQSVFGNKDVTIKSNSYEKDGYTFAGWNTAADGSGTSYSEGQVVTSPLMGSAGEFTLYAQWTAKNYTLTYDANGGTCATANKSVAYNAAIGTLPSATKTGYDFDGWYTEASGGTKVESTTVYSTINGATNASIYAHWAAKEYTVTFNANGGTCATTDTNVAYDAAFGTLPSATKTGYDFDGWYTAASGGTKVTSTTKYNLVFGAQNGTLYAQWSVKKYTLTFNANGGNCSTSNASVAYDATLGTLPNATKTGFNFNGWYTQSSGGDKVTSSTKYDSIFGAQNGTLYAQWSVKNYTLTFDANGGTCATSNASVAYNATVGTLPSATRTGYDFDGWYTATSGGRKVESTTAYSSISGAKNATIYAQWTAKNYTLTFDANGGTCATSNESVAYDATLGTLPSATKTGYDFDGWYTAASGGTKVASTTVYSTIDGAKDTTIYAHWTAKKYTLTFNANGGTCATSNASIAYDATLGTLPSATRTGYDFEGWYTQSSGGTKIESATVYSSINGAANATIYAQWSVKDFTVTFNANGGTCAITNASVAYNAAIGTLPSATRTGYDFEGWYTAANGGTEVESTDIYANVAGARDSVLYAHWNAKTYTVTLDANGGTCATTSVGVAYNGTYGHLPTPTQDGYRFKGWFDDPTSGNKIIETSIYSTAADCTLYAHWEEIVEIYITYNLNGGTNSAANPTMFLPADANIKLTAPTRAGYRFDGWFRESAFTTKVTCIVCADEKNDVELYAKWTPITYNIQFVNTDKKAKGSMNPVYNLNYDETYTLPVCGFTKKGYACTWNTSNTYNGIAIADAGSFKNLTSVDGETITLYSQWSIANYSISYELNGGINNAKNPQSYTMNSKTIKLKNPKKAGYVFVGWYTNPNMKSKYKIESINKGSVGDKVLYAKWTANKYTVSMVGNKSTSGSGKTMNCVYGKAYTLKANKFKRTGYTFAGWNTKANGKGIAYSDRQVISNLSTKNGGNITLYAQWQKIDYTIMYELDGGVNDPSNPSTYNVASKKINLKNPTKEGYKFAGWYLDPKYKKKVTSIAKGSTGNKTIYAKWIAQ